MTTTALDFCSGLCKSADHYIIYPYSYNREDVYNDVYYIKCEYDNRDTEYYTVYRNSGSGHYRFSEIHANEFIAPSNADFYYSDTGSDIVGVPVARYVHTFGIDLYGCFLIGAVLTAIIGGVVHRCMR